MSRENVEVVRRIYEAVARQDADAVLDLYHPEVTWDFSRSPFASVLTRTAYRGPDGLRSFTRERHEAWRDVADELEELVDAGDAVVSVVRTRGHGRRSGAEAALRHAGAWTIEDGRVVQVVWFPSRREALEAVGLRE